MNTPLYTASAVSEMASATLILDSDRKTIAEAETVALADEIAHRCNCHNALLTELNKAHCLIITVGAELTVRPYTIADHELFRTVAYNIRKALQHAESVF